MEGRVNKVPNLGLAILVPSDQAKAALSWPDSYRESKE
jgi:hypothetical protein